MEFWGELRLYNQSHQSLTTKKTTMINPFNLINQIQAKFVGLMLAALCLSNVVSAQTANEKKHENTWEIGIDVLPLIRDTSHHIRESILVKRKIYDDLKARGRFGIYFDAVKNHPTTEPITDTIFGYRPRLYTSIGVEKSICTLGKINVNGGLDGFVFYRRNKVRQHIKTFTATPATDTERFIDDKELKTGINAFINAEYVISHHFVVNIESFWQFAYRKERYFNEEYQFGQLSQDGGRTIRRFVTQLQPISSINLIYKF